MLLRRPVPLKRFDGSGVLTRPAWRRAAPADLGAAQDVQAKIRVTTSPRLGLRFRLFRQEQPQILADGQRAWMIRTKTAPEYADGAAEEGLGLGQAVRDSQKLRQVVEVPGYVWMAGAKAGLVDGEGTAEKGLGLGQAARGLQKRRQVVEIPGYVWMVGAKAGLVDGEGTAGKGLGLGQAVRDSQKLRQVVDVNGYVWMVGAKAGLVDSEGTAGKGLSLGQAVRGLQKRRQVVEVNGYFWMVGAKAGLADSEGAAVQGLGLGQTVRCKPCGAKAVPDSLPGALGGDLRSVHLRRKEFAVLIMYGFPTGCYLACVRHGWESQWC